MAYASTDELLDRDGELAELLGLIAEVDAGSGRAAVIEGAPGIGKSSVLAAALAQAEAAGFDTTRARASELERDFAFGLVRQLFEPRIAKADPKLRDELFAGAARHAAALLGSDDLPDDGSPPEASHAVLHGLYWLTVNLTSEGPLALFVDDLHWGDAPSLRFLAYLVNRVEDLPVLLVAAARPFEPGAETDLIDELASNPAARVIRPGPLGPDAVRGMIGAATQEDPDPRFCAACRDATGGNPLLLHELLVTLTDEGLSPTAKDADRVQEIAPRSVVRSVSRRLRRLDPEATEVARAIAVLGDGADAGAVAQLSGVSQGTVASAAGALAQTDILRHDALEFAHPLVRAAIYSELPAPERARRHQQAARILADHGSDEDAVAVHLLVADPSGDEWVIDVLRRAARRAHARGAPDVAATYLERALSEASGSGDRGRADLHVELALAELDATRFEGLSRLRRALELTEDASSRGRVALLLGRWMFSWGDLAGAALVFEDALEHLGDADPKLRATLDAYHLAAAMATPGLADTVRGRFEELWETRDDVTHPILLAGLGAVGAQMFPPAGNGADLAERALATDEISYVDDPAIVAVAATPIMTAGRLKTAERVYDGAEAAARRRGAVFPLGFAWTLRAAVHVRSGKLAAAEADARGALFDLARAGQVLSLVFVITSLIDVLIERGELDEASGLVDDYGLGGDLPNFVQMNYLLDSIGRLRIAQNRLDEGIDYLRELGRRLEEWGTRNPGFVPWRTNMAPALAASGAREEALELVEAEIELARAFDVPRELGMGLRAAALIEGGDRGIALLHEAVAVLEGSEARLEHARALTDLGAALRRGGQRAAAREPLKAGLDMAQSCGATALGERAHSELVASGARPRRLVLRGVDSLTASERRVAEMASEGLTNREIAQGLFVTEKTVEGHLGHAYRKLDISSRSELPTALVRQPDAAAA
jgi:DNA-binding CsgD family transcriptional regulator